MMPPAQQNEILQTRGAAIGPMRDVMTVAPASGAAGKLTVAVARHERAVNGRRDGARLASDVEQRPVRFVLHDHYHASQHYAPRRFRGNAGRAAIQFQHGLPRIRNGRYGIRTQGGRVQMHDHLIAVRCRSPIEIAG